MACDGFAFSTKFSVSRRPESESDHPELRGANPMMRGHGLSTVGAMHRPNEDPSQGVMLSNKSLGPIIAGITFT
ncbi:uncharacterized protein LOC101036380 [Anopheles sinensis]|uniref:Uncharacterized protein LOC101036380 n=1 Tax=Anopheles sinensis TaxID=74873 RepID=A0A084VDK9_ANOSI|nr:uncharacterized protein LOC101036380 [Anopheles sinensis]